MKAIFSSLCPNCHGDICDERLASGIPCKNCLPNPTTGLENVIKSLVVKGDLIKIWELEKRLEKFSKRFKEMVKSEPWNLQKVWARRVFLGRSFAILAPTGIGKTTAGLVLADFVLGKSYLIFPTTALVIQAKERLETMGTKREVVAYHSKMKVKEKKEVLEKISSGDFDILITTTMFLYRNFETLRKTRFSFIFVDDVDSFLKTAKNIDKVLMLLGFSEEDIAMGMEIIKMKSKLARSSDKSLLKRLRELEEKLEHSKSRITGSLVVSSATAKPRSSRVKLFRELLGFEVGRTISTLRNVDDYVIKNPGEIKKETLSLIKTLGPGGLIFVPSDLGKDYVHEMVGFLNDNGVNAGSYEDIENILGDFANGKLDVLVGISSYRNPLARGIDLPTRIRYAIFSGVPKLMFPLRLEPNPSRLLSLLILLRSNLDDRADRYIRALRRYRHLNSLESLNESARRLVLEAMDYLEPYLNSPEFLKNLSDISIRRTNGENFIVIGDVAGYIQASGRTSRMYSNGITKGLSILLVDDETAFRRLEKQISWFIDDFKFMDFSIESVKRTLKEVDRTRKELIDALSGKAKKKEKEFVKTVGVIVESPNKARTIASFFGRPMKRMVKNVPVYEINTGEYIINIMASQGHVFDLVTSEGLYGVLEIDGKYVPKYDTIKRCLDCGYQFVEGDSCPVCGSKNILDKSRFVEAMQELAKETNFVLVASDPDTEGEKIAWDISLAIRPFSNISRIEFHEVTKRAFLEAVKNRRDIDEKLVEAQITRRIADRWVGFSLSKRVQEKFRSRNLSAGRVQSPVLNWIIEKWMESKKKKWITIAYLDGVKLEFEGKTESNKVTVEVIDEREEELTPSPPYTTDTLLRDASLTLGFDSTKTMNLAQDLFEAGMITYHRTDSTRVSDFGMRLAKEYIEEEFGKGLARPRRWSSSLGAHECIRPTRPLDLAQLKQYLAMREINLSRDHLALYNLVFKRFIKSQMRAVKARITRYRLKLGDLEKDITLVNKILEHGWDLISPVEIKSLAPGAYRIEKKEKRIPMAFPYTFGEIISKMKEEGIGRPSTYAKIIQTLLDRRYVINAKGRLIPTKKGIMVNSFLQKKYPDLVSVEFTRKLESEMNKIEQGYNYQSVLRSLEKTIKSV